MRILFLGRDDSPLLDFIKQNEEFVYQTMEVVTPEFCLENKFNFLVSYRYRRILKSNVLELFNERAINLHTSFLPWNRGADPVFWSLFESTPMGVSIHQIDSNIDTGNILLQKQVDFPIDATLGSVNLALHHEIQKLFYLNWDLIKKGKITTNPQQKGVGSFHKLKDKEQFLENLLLQGEATLVSSIINRGKQSWS